MPSKETIPKVIERLFSARTNVTSPEVAAAAGVSRQTAYNWLSRMTAEGLLTKEGNKRSTRYHLNAQRATTYPLEGLTENEVWGHERIALRQFDPDIEEMPTFRQVLNFAFTEMVNNAIDHSRGSELRVRWFLKENMLAFEIEDDGIGAFESLRESRGLKDDFEAVGELSKGKQTTDPARHSGLGIFLTSRLVNRFVLAANHLTWTVDTDLDDSAVGWLDRPRHGTLVRCEVLYDTTMTLTAVMSALQDPVTQRLNKTSIRIDLFRQGDFVSRTEAKLIGARLEGFEVIELDFRGITQIGQGFADELFRVWANDHPSSHLVPVNANPAVRAVIASVERRAG
jgi:anti-sigma regulatory factor (Ser/Thr protein kinase)